MPLNPFALNRSTQDLGRTALAVGLGYIVSVIVVMVGFALISQFWPEVVPNIQAGEAPGRDILQLSLALSLIAAIAAGYITAKVSPLNPKKNVKILFFVMVALAVVTMIAEGDIKPLWWHIALVLLMAVGLSCGLHLVTRKQVRTPNS